MARSRRRHSDIRLGKTALLSDRVHILHQKSEVIEAEMQVPSLMGNRVSVVDTVLEVKKRKLL